MAAHEDPPTRVFRSILSETPRASADSIEANRQCYASEMRDFKRISIDPEVMGGKPCIRGMRVTVSMIIGSLGAGRSVPELLADFPYLEEPDISEALRFAAFVTEGRDVPLAS